MGVEYRAAIVVGLPYNDFSEDKHQLFEDETLEMFGPYFDAGWDDSLFGFSLVQSGDYSATEFVMSLELANKLATISAKFKDITGLEAKTYLTPVGW